MIREAGIDEARVRLANAIPFRPIASNIGGPVSQPNAHRERTQSHGQSVLGDIAKVQPKIIGALGKSAAMLFGASMTVQRSRKRTFQFQNIPVRITFIRDSCCDLAEEAPRSGSQQSST
jgi:DNA polymerase